MIAKTVDLCDIFCMTKEKREKEIARLFFVCSVVVSTCLMTERFGVPVRSVPVSCFPSCLREYSFVHPFSDIFFCVYFVFLSVSSAKERGIS